MKRIFLSADIEGTCGIAHWDESLPEKQDYARFQRQMTREVAGRKFSSVTDTTTPGIFSRRRCRRISRSCAAGDAILGP